ncbi:MAG: DNA cytosine methyltransferase [Solirubrobacteraceae bacterium MAG38_C4-C5]|nr:DNA cytosine methyltransferase [Candidatus Siliceabacter maunaloa]
MPKPTALDLFSGAGGTTQGLRDAGFNVVAAVEKDEDAAKSFAANHPDTLLLDRDIRYVQAPALARRLSAAGGRLDLLTACPPCQPFSTLGTGRADDERNGLVSTLARFVRNLRPRMIVLENVPGLKAEPRFRRLVDELFEDYAVTEQIVQATDFGVPQRRRRIIVVGVDRELGVTPPGDLLAALPDRFNLSPRTAGDALAKVVTLSPEFDPLHRARTPRLKTLARIKATKQGGGRLDLPLELQLDCHTKLDRRDATSIYGRIDPSKPAPTMTTRCTTPSCGRFVHPTEHRGLTLREAALIQTFPTTYAFEGGYDSAERQIGNAVPPRLAEALGTVVRDLLAAADAAAADRRAQSQTA